MSKKAKCSQCIEYIEKIYLLEQKVKSLQAKLRYQERKITEGYFTSQTPSSKKPFKSNTPAAEKKNIGGAKAGHKGNGRKSLNAEQADVIKRVKHLNYVLVVMSS